MSGHGRRRYLVAYDIADDRRRSRTFNVLADFGDHVQYSVFLCEVSERELVSLRARVTAEIVQTQDQVLVVDLGPAEAETSESVCHIGRPLPIRPRLHVV